MEWLVVITNAKPLWGHALTPIENDVFWYQKIVLPSTWTLEIENFQLQRIIEDLVKFLNKVACEIDGSDHFSTMNICKEHDSC
jgi:hypothetical protein